MLFVLSQPTVTRAVQSTVLGTVGTEWHKAALAFQQLIIWQEDEGGATNLRVFLFLQGQLCQAPHKHTARHQLGEDSPQDAERRAGCPGTLHRLTCSLKTPCIS